MKAKIILICCISFLCAYVLYSVLPLDGEEEIYENMIRLHVIANSDSNEDQELKLEVRDSILQRVSEIKAENPHDAYLKVEGAIEELKSTAEKTIKEKGYDYTVYVTLSEEKYPEREYSGFVLPQGNYTSLRVLIGSSEGQNWWCVLYPPLCTSAATEREEEFVAAGFTGEQYKAITDSESGSYKVKFKIVEIIKELFK